LATGLAATLSGAPPASMAALAELVIWLFHFGK
jgi:hypothetical protein